MLFNPPSNFLPITLFNQPFSSFVLYLFPDSSVLKYAQLPCHSGAGCVQVFDKDLKEFMSNSLQVEGKYVLVRVGLDFILFSKKKMESSITIFITHRNQQ